jgi:predicted nucleic acid-binding Zn ribbon protein
MNFHDKRFRRIVSIIILLLIAAMVLTMVLPYII